MVSFVPITSRIAVYHGPPSGLWAPRIFGDFAQSKAVDRLAELGYPSSVEIYRNYGGRFNPDRVLYNYPEASMAFAYSPRDIDRCEVDLIGEPSERLLHMLAFVLNESGRDQKQAA